LNESSKKTDTRTGRRSFIAGEAGREFIINGEALRNPVVADLARIINSLQLSGTYKTLSYATGSGGGSTAAAGGMDTAAIVAAILSLKPDIQESGNRKINLNYLDLEEKARQVEQIWGGAAPPYLYCNSIDSDPRRYLAAGKESPPHSYRFLLPCFITPFL